MHAASLSLLVVSSVLSMAASSAQSRPSSVLPMASTRPSLSPVSIGTGGGNSSAAPVLGGASMASSAVAAAVAAAAAAAAAAAPPLPFRLAVLPVASTAPRSPSPPPPPSPPRRPVSSVGGGSSSSSAAAAAAGSGGRSSPASTAAVGGVPMLDEWRARMFGRADSKAVNCKAPHDSLTNQQLQFVASAEKLFASLLPPEFAAASAAKKPHTPTAAAAGPRPRVAAAAAAASSSSAAAAAAAATARPDQVEPTSVRRLDLDEYSRDAPLLLFKPSYRPSNISSREMRLAVSKEANAKNETLFAHNATTPTLVLDRDKKSGTIALVRMERKTKWAPSAALVRKDTTTIDDYHDVVALQSAIVGSAVFVANTDEQSALRNFRSDTKSALAALSSEMRQVRDFAIEYLTKHRVEYELHLDTKARSKHEQIKETPPVHDATQMYIKRVFAYTDFHTEIGFSSALNLMRADSLGAAFWIGFKWSDVVRLCGIKEAMGIMNGRIGFGSALGKFNKKGVPLTFVVQTPGTAVYSPSSPDGTGHAVLSIGPDMIQGAINMGMNIDAIRAALYEFRDAPNVRRNGGDATRFVLPVLRMQARGLDLGLASQLDAARRTHQFILLRVPTMNYTDFSEIRADCKICEECECVLDLYSYYADLLCMSCVIVQINQNADKSLDLMASSRGLASKRLRVDDSETESNKKKMRMDAAPAATDAAAAAAATDVPLQDFDADKLNLIMKGDATDAKKALSALTSEVKELARARDQARANLDKVEAEIVTKQKEADALRVVFESADSVAREGETAIAVLQQQFDECARTFSEAQRKLDLVVNQIDDQLARLRKPSSSS